jgi:very-short-patch-repair endonuclease
MTPKDPYLESMSPGSEWYTYERANKLRRNLTKAEEILWSNVRIFRRSIHGFRFRRQHPFGPFILDFYCHQALLAVEIDGGYHENQKQHQYDEMRTQYLKERGLEVIRFNNEEVEKNVNKVMHFMEAKALERIKSINEAKNGSMKSP